MTRIVPAVSDAVLRDIIGDAAIVSIAFYCIAVALLLLAEGARVHRRRPPWWMLLHLPDDSHTRGLLWPWLTLHRNQYNLLHSRNVWLWWKGLFWRERM